MITDEDIRTAEARVTEVKERGARLRMANRDETADAVRLAVGRLEELRELKAAQDSAIKSRKAAEKSHTPEMKKMSAELSDSAEAVNKARDDASHALDKLIFALRCHNTAVGAAHARLTALGLPLADEDAEYDTGHGSSGALRISGTDWKPVPEDAMVQHTVAEVIKREFGAKHPAARVHDVRAHSLLRGGAGGLKVA
ncbi:hypothetical protein OR263_25580 [Streptomyces sp. NEAU-H22]|uniref:hypothetical protein n=1 Tax=Streptomyces sp. NEAU-H22 TaxID=2994655 RepID=UPI002254D9A6|nr:hypothetical protein [Streptomyces sp. NEAU-H22]MCX3290042.1 hypothetical protein [Streptomyces sp. NEAU-H22]